jgi:sigma-B regulation protein RsbU (phosphoserine phosphatase)
LRITIFLVIVFLIVSIVISFILSLKISKTITSPVYNLVETSKLITQGNYQVRAEIKSRDELATLGTAFNTMVERLQDNIEKLDEKVEERTHELKNAYDIIKKDLFLAKQIQTNFLSSNYTSINELEFKVYFKPMMEVGGDIYDIFELNPGYYRIFIADATGHGIQAALITMIIKSEYEKIKSFELNPEMILKIFNSVFMENYYSLNVFFSCIILDIDTNNDEIKYSSAGHPDQYFINNTEITVLQTGGRLIGVLPGIDYESINVKIEKGSKLIMFTDGVFEEFSQIKMEELGETRFLEILKNNRTKPVSELIDHVILKVNEWIGANAVNDDITLIGIEYLK